jgi:hypothetical protein
MNRACFHLSLGVVILACPPTQNTTGTVDAHGLGVLAGRPDASDDVTPSTISRDDAKALTKAELAPTIVKGRRKALVCFRDSVDCAARARFRIAPSGDVVEVSLGRLSGEELPRKVAECLDGIIREWRFPDAGVDTWVSHIWECKKE